MDVTPLWNYADPAASEAAFRDALARTTDRNDALTLRTQIARTLGLRSRFAEAHAALDAIEPELAAAGPEPRVRYLLERGRTYRSEKDPARARPLFDAASLIAEQAGLDALHVDALHMIALVEPAPEAQLRWNEQALAVALASPDPVARRWEASLANNIGMSLDEAGRHDDALTSFRRALAARERIGKADDVRVAQWTVAWEMRSLKRHDEALALLHHLEAEFAALGTPDGFVFEEIAENLLAQGHADAARPYFASAFRVLSADTSLDRPGAARLARLQRLAK